MKFGWLRCSSALVTARMGSPLLLHVCDFFFVCIQTVTYHCLYPMLLLCGEFACGKLKRLQMRFSVRPHCLPSLKSELFFLHSPSISTNNLSISCPGEEELRQPACYQSTYSGERCALGKESARELTQSSYHLDAWQTD